jgi:hypothetical protein
MRGRTVAASGKRGRADAARADDQDMRMTTNYAGTIEC